MSNFLYSVCPVSKLYNNDMIQCDILISFLEEPQKHYKYGQGQLKIRVLPENDFAGKFIKLLISSHELFFN